MIIHFAKRQLLYQLVQYLYGVSLKFYINHGRATCSIYNCCNFIVLCVSDLIEFLYGICTILLWTYLGVLRMLLIALLYWWCVHIHSGECSTVPVFNTRTLSSKMAEFQSKGLLKRHREGNPSYIYKTIKDKSTSCYLTTIARRQVHPNHGFWVKKFATSYHCSTQWWFWIRPTIHFEI